MKNTLKFFALAAVVAAFASCNKVEAPADKGDFAPLTISAGTETKSVLRNDTDVYWISSDILSVFDNDSNYYGFQNTSTDATPTTDFVYDSWPSDKTPVFAVYCYTNGETTRASFDGNKATAILYATQKIYNKKSYAKFTGLSVGEVAYDGSNYTVEQMKNCYSLIQFSVKNSDILSIEVSGTNDEQLGGWVDIDYSKIKAIGEDNHADPFWTGTAGKTKAKTITLTIDGNAGITTGDKKTFDNNTCYYIAVLPQVVQGLSFKVTKADGTSETQVVNGPITLNRSKIKQLSKPVDNELFQPTNYIKLDFNDASKFVSANGSIPARGNAPSSSFEFWYDVDGMKDYKFEGKPYCWTSGSRNVLCTATRNLIKLPDIDGYELSEVILNYAHAPSSGNGRKYIITDGTITGTDSNGNNTYRELATCTMMRTDSAKTMTVNSSSASTSARYIQCIGEMCIEFSLKYLPVSQ